MKCDNGNFEMTCKIDVSCLDLAVISPHFLFLPGLCNSWAVCFCTSRCKYALLSDCHLPYWPTPAHSLQATTMPSLHPTLQRWNFSNTDLLILLTLTTSSSMHWLKWQWRSWEIMISCSFVARDVTVFSDDCHWKPACFWREMSLFTLTPSVMFVIVRLALFCSDQLLWNNPVWLVSSNFLPTLQLTKLHQLAMQHIPLPSLGQSNPTFPGTYPRLPGEVHQSPCLHSSLESHHQNTLVTAERIKDVSFLSEATDSHRFFCKRGFTALASFCTTK